MKQGIDRELYNEAKEKRTKKMIEQIHKKNSKMNSSSDNFDEFIGKKKTFKQKSEKSFRITSTALLKNRQCFFKKTSITF